MPGWRAGRRKMIPRIGQTAVIIAIWTVLGYPYSVPGSCPHQLNSRQSAGETGDLTARLQAMSPEEQVDFIRRAREEGRWNAVLSYYLGNALFRQGEVDSAVSYYRESVTMDSTYSRSYVNLGIALEQLKKFDDARSSYERALDADPEDVLAHCHLGYFHYVRGRYSRAVGHYRKALEADPMSAQAHYYLGVAFADAKVFREAIAEWRKVAEIAPDSELGKTAAENAGLIEQYIELEAE